MSALTDLLAEKRARQAAERQLAAVRALLAREVKAGRFTVLVDDLTPLVKDQS